MGTGARTAGKIMYAATSVDKLDRGSAKVGRYFAKLVRNFAKPDRCFAKFVRYLAKPAKRSAKLGAYSAKRDR